MTLGKLARAGELDQRGEGIQALLPNRVYDNFDVLSNAIAALIGIAGRVVVAWANVALDRRGGVGT